MLPTEVRDGVVAAAGAALADGLGRVCLVAGVAAFVGAGLALVLIRGKDRVAVVAPEEAAEVTA
ncbi:hypothetical protein [Streptomyces capitiformicae]|uniref:Uncharacterized protein n=1 Tax=Streptomyces capitiformicae TaxID=2014920 RepID=A0A918Z280_9ACTN|nr:hypothetical protein [Streptomyces capitiformicae]GHE30699.1 hypothetical protein GCM10017771_46990 [Streptomyces capitiformicae]